MLEECLGDDISSFEYLLLDRIKDNYVKGPFSIGSETISLCDRRKSRLPKNQMPLNERARLAKNWHGNGPTCGKTREELEGISLGSCGYNPVQNPFCLLKFM